MKIAEVKHQEEEQFYAIQPGNFFAGKLWCSCFDQRLKKFFILDEKEQPIGGFVAFEGGKSGLKTLITAPFAPHIGLFTSEYKSNPVKAITLQKQIIEVIGTFIKSSSYVFYKLDFPPEWNDMQTLVWQNIQPKVRYTYRLNLEQSVNDITQNLDPSKRNKISKATRDGFRVSHEPDIELAQSMLSETLSRQSIALHPEIMKRILSLSAETSQGIWTISQFENKPVALNICLTTHDTCYNLLSAIDRKSGFNHAGTFSLFNSILRAKELKLKTFDFEGSGVPEIEKFFRSFGGHITPYFSISGGKFPWVQLIRWKQKRAR